MSEGSWADGHTFWHGQRAGDHPERVFKKIYGVTAWHLHVYVVNYKCLCLTPVASHCHSRLNHARTTLLISADRTHFSIKRRQSPTHLPETCKTAARLEQRESAQGNPAVPSRSATTHGSNASHSLIFDALRKRSPAWSTFRSSLQQSRLHTFAEHPWAIRKVLAGARQTSKESSSKAPQFPCQRHLPSSFQPTLPAGRCSLVSSPRHLWTKR